MCMIALQPAGVQLSGNKFRNAWERNKDGGGYAYPQDDAVIIKKGYFDVVTMLDDYRADVEAHPDVPFLIHFRISTSGKTDEVNTHPHRVRPDLVIAHNGHIRGYGDEEQSDTLEFVNIILQQMPALWEEDPIQTHLVERYIERDKMVVLRSDGEYVILNEDLGHWKDKIWFSNKSYQKRIQFKGGWQGTRGHTPPTKAALFPSQYVACGWDEDDMYVGGTEQGLLQTGTELETFLDEQCAYCDTRLDQGDAEFNIALDSWYPVCSDCVIENEVELINTGAIADAVEECWDEVFIDNPTPQSLLLEEEEEDKTPATSGLMRFTTNVFSS